MKFLRRLKKYKQYYIEPGVYLYGKSNRVCNTGITSTVRFLEKFYVSARDEKEAHEIAFIKLKIEYPDWNVWIF